MFYLSILSHKETKIEVEIEQIFLLVGPWDWRLGSLTISFLIPFALKGIGRLQQILILLLSAWMCLEGCISC